MVLSSGSTMTCTAYWLQGELTSHLKYGSRGSRVDQSGWNDPETSFSKNEKKKSKLGSENQSDNPRSPWGFAKLRCFSGRVSLKRTDYCLSILRTAPPKQSHNNNCLCEMLSKTIPFLRPLLYWVSLFQRINSYFSSISNWKHCHLVY